MTLNRVEQFQYSMGPQLLTADRDDLLTTFADDACRKTVSRLETHDRSTMSLDELATGTRTEAATGGGPSATALHHAVLPKLAAAGILSYDPSSRTVHYKGQERVKAVLAANERISQ